MKVVRSSIAGFLTLINDTPATMTIAGLAIESGGSRDLPQGEAAPFLDPDNPEHLACLPSHGPADKTAEEIEAEVQERGRAETARAAEERAAEELEQKPRDAAEAAGKKIADLLANSVDNITGSFPVLADDEITALRMAEAAKGDGARKRLLEAVAKETALRAQRNSRQ